MSRAWTAALVAAFALTACGGDSGSTEPPADDPVTSVTVSPAADTVLVGDMVSFQATARTRSGATATGTTTTWSSSQTGVATVDAQGRVTGVAPGTSEIRATAAGVSGTADVVVQPRPVASIEVSPAVDTVRVGQQTTFSATPRDDQGTETNDAVTWTSDDPAVATVEAATPAPRLGASLALVTEGVVTGVAPGTATLRATAGTVEQTTTIVVEAEPVSSVEVTPPSGLRVGLTLAATASPLTAVGAAVAGCTISWAVSDAAVAGVDAAGAVSALAAGTTTLTASADCGPAGQAQGTADINVDPSRVVAVGTGRRFVCALIEDASLGVRDRGDVYCWGANNHGQIGDGTFTDRSVPTRVDFAGHFGGSEEGANPSRRAAEMLVVGDEHACALDEDGAAWCWGDNNNGQIGDGTVVDRTRPVAVSTSLRFKALTAGEEFTCGVHLDDDQASCWGESTDGQLGNGSTLDRLTPVLVLGGHTWSMLRAGEDTICGITTGTETYCWGDNNQGGVGDGTLVAIRALPTLVAPPSAGASRIEFDFIGRAEDQGCGLEAGTGRAWCWGENTFGQLGIGSTGGQRNVPVEVAGPNNVFRALSNGGDDEATTMCGILPSAADFGGPALCWGKNDDGQLGDGTLTLRNVPTALATSEEFLFLTPADSNTCGITSEWRLMCWGEDTRGQLGNGLPLLGNPTPDFVPFPAGAPLSQPGG